MHDIPSHICELAQVFFRDGQAARGGYGGGAGEGLEVRREVVEDEDLGVDMGCCVLFKLIR